MNEIIQKYETRHDFKGDGIQREFPCSFIAYNSYDLKIFVDKEQKEDGFSIQKLGGHENIIVVFEVAPASNSLVQIIRQTIPSRQGKFANNIELSTEALNSEYNHLVAVTRDLKNQLDNSVKRNLTSQNKADLSLPDPIANRALRWNATGDGLENTSLDADQVATLTQAAQTASEGARDTAINARDQAQGYRLAASNDAASAATSATNIAANVASATASATAAATSASAAQVAKIEWQGAWISSANYNLNDAVTHSGSSYICKLASTGNTPPNATHWDVLATKGTDGQGAGTVTTITPGVGFTSSAAITAAGTLDVKTGTAAGDIIQIGSDGKLPASDGSKLTNLSAPNIVGLGSLALLNNIDNQNISNTTGNLPISRITGNLSSAIISTSVHSNSTRTTMPNTSSYTMWSVSHNKQQASSKLIIIAHMMGHGDNGSAADLATGYIQAGSTKNYCLNANQARSYLNNFSGQSHFTTSSTGNISVSVGWSTANGGNGKPFNIWNPSSSDFSRYNQSTSSIIVMEVA